MSVGRGDASHMVIEDNSDLKTDTRLARNSTASTFAKVAMARQNMSFYDAPVTPKGFKSKYLVPSKLLSNRNRKTNATIA